MISHKSQKLTLNLSKTAKNQFKTNIDIDTKNNSIVDTFMQK
jgi:hypothetical protein